MSPIKCPRTDELFIKGEEQGIFENNRLILDGSLRCLLLGQFFVSAYVFVFL